MSLAALSVSEFLERLASKSPTPGGGAVAGVLGATSASLAQMVVAYSIGRKSLAEHEHALRQADEQLRAARAACLRLADADAQAYERLNAAMRLPPDHANRASLIAEAARGALGPPLELCSIASELALLCESLAGRTNPHLASDLAIAGSLAGACADSARWNVRANTPLLPDADRPSPLARADRLVELAASAASRLHEVIARAGAL